MQVKIFYDKIGNIVYFTTGEKDSYNGLPSVALDLTIDQLNEIKKYYIRLSDKSLFPKSAFYYIYDLATGEILTSFAGGICQTEPFFAVEEEIKDYNRVKYIDSAVVIKSESELAIIDSEKDAKQQAGYKALAIDVLKDLFLMDQLKKYDKTSIKIKTLIDEKYTECENKLNDILSKIK